MKVNLLDSNCIPFKKHETDAGWDLKCSKAFSVGPGKNKPVHLGIKIEIPEGHVGLMFPRSGLSTSKGLVLANVVGVIDSDYRGEVIAVVKNESTRTIRINQYERICQLVIVPINLNKFEIVTELSETERSEGGFGSTNEKNDKNTNGTENNKSGDRNNSIEEKEPINKGNGNPNSESRVKT